MGILRDKYRQFFFLCIFLCSAIIFSVSTAFHVNFPEGRVENPFRPRSRSLLEVSNDTLIKCIPSGIDSFPEDFFTQQERQLGGAIVHVIIAFYTCAMIGIVCHDYFVPSLEIISERLKLPPDIAGATFMAIGTSAPELFSSVTGSFITEGDIGIGTIIGSAVFNMVGVTGLVGVILWKTVLDIEWYPIARDCLVYGLTILVLVWIIYDNIVTRMESFILLMVFALYIVIICYNKTLERWSKNLARRIEGNSCCCCWYDKERKPLINERVFRPEITESQQTQDKRTERDSFSVEFTASQENAILRNDSISGKKDKILLSTEEMANGTLWSSPSDGGWKMCWWILLYPIRLILFITIPDCRKERLRKLYVITFLISVVWIGLLSYVAVWMVTIIGYTISVPDSVSGLTILAAGTSIPEIITSTIVARNGFGNMAISNLVGSNTFDISFCLGAPWFIKTCINQTGYILIFSSALTYTTATLFITLGVFVLVFMISGWKLTRTVGFTYILIYVVFVIIACMYEMNVFGNINAKVCN